MSDSSTAIICHGIICHGIIHERLAGIRVLESVNLLKETLTTLGEINKNKCI